ncbi:lipopolysaccharide assembly protein LapA domain-containing protein [Gammaproteobacteria bacterium]|nr:lipopolysaccharide assembly protein LapA domain-containing protein [Gammaproteobacteria bacterium]
MRFFTLILLLCFTLVALSSYLLLSLNKEIVLIDLLFTEVQMTLGIALLSFFSLGFLVTLVLELINSFRKNKLKE